MERGEGSSDAVASRANWNSVRVFGFGANRNGVWDHYFEKVPSSFKTGGHKGSFEYDIIKELDKRNKIEMFRGW